MTTHICLCDDNVWRACPESLCEADKLLAANEQLLARLGVAEAYIPSQDFADYQGDAERT